METQEAQYVGGLQTGQQLACGKAVWQPIDEDFEKVATICHEANRAICVMNGDNSQPSWDDAPAWQKESAISGVKYHFKNQHASDRDSHDQWMETKLRDGWRYGEVKNVETKTHPCLLPFHALPENERVKDTVFKAIVAGYLKAKRGW